MRKLLEETLMGGEVYGLYSKIDSCSMFGYYAKDSMFGFDLPLLTELFNDKPSSPPSGYGSARGSGVGSARDSTLTEQPYWITSSHEGRGTMKIHRSTGDCLHTFDDGGAHIDLGSKHSIKLEIEKNPFDRYDNFIGKKIKGTGGFF